MANIDISKRIEFLVKSFDVFENMEEKLEELKKDDYIITPINGNDGELLAFVYNKKDSNKYSSSIYIDVLSNIIAADPTENKIYIQWMLNMVNKLLKEPNIEIRDLSIDKVKRFICEDLPQANDYLKIFENNKRKAKFSENVNLTYSIKHISDPRDINQYKSLSQLFDAIDPFIEKNPSELEKLMMKYVEMGKATIPVKDRKFTIYIPKTNDASVIFGNFASWCTARKNNSMFKHYTDYKRPNGEKSKLYVIINNDFYSGKSTELYQIHFESNQIKDKSNIQANIYESVIRESENVAEYLKDELIKYAKQLNTNLLDNNYVKILLALGFSESIFEIMDENTPMIRFINKELPRLPNISKFKNLQFITIINSGLIDISNSIGENKDLRVLSLRNNKIKALPDEICLLKNLTYINIKENQMKQWVVPTNIKFLDKSNGGCLEMITVDEKDVGEANYKKLKELLPTTKFTNSDF